MIHAWVEFTTNVLIKIVKFTIPPGVISIELIKVVIPFDSKGTSYHVCY